MDTESLQTRRQLILESREKKLAKRKQVKLDKLEAEYQLMLRHRRIRRRSRR